MPSEEMNAQNITFVLTALVSLTTIIGGIVGAIIIYRKAPREADQLAANAEKMRAEVNKIYMELAGDAGIEIQKLKENQGLLEERIQKCETENNQLKVEKEALEHRVNLIEFENCILEEWAHDLIQQIIELHGIPKEKPNKPKKERKN